VTGGAAAARRARPLVAVLCAAARAEASACALALALAQLTGASCAVAAAAGGGAGNGAVGSLLAPRRAAERLRRVGLPATARGRLAWVADRRGDPDEDVAGHAAALSAELRRAASAVDSPAAIALPFPRTAALDRALAWHDALVVVPEGDVSQAMLERALGSLAALGRPVAAMAPSQRSAATLARLGLRAPDEARAAVARLELAGVGSGRGDA
jgi:hypothetical protein